jgi:hypothetical protein
MHAAPDHSPAAAAAEHAALIVALDAGDLAGRERDTATTLAGTCAGCTSLLADLAVLRAATAALAATPRTRDYRLTEADAARLRPSTWTSLIRWLAAPRSSVRPLAGGLAALGIAGLLLTTTPGFLGGAATSLSTTGAPVVAPGGAEGAGGAVGGNALPGATPSAAPSAASSAAPSAASSAPARPNGAAPIEPAASAASAAGPVLGAPGTTPGLAALPAPSPAAVGAPGPAQVPDAGTVPGPAAIASAAAGSSGFSTGAGATTDTANKAAPPEASQADRSSVLPAPSPPAPPDRTLPLLLSLALLGAGLGLLAANQALRRHAGS